MGSFKFNMIMKIVPLAVSLLLIFNEVEGKVLSADCATLSGEACKFPFTFDNVIYTGCTTAGTGNSNTKWCPTVENWKKYRLYQERNYGPCSDGCQGVSKFPSALYVSSGVSASEYPDMEGEYEITFDSYYGKPVYKHESKFLFLNSYNNWVIRYGAVDPELAHAYAETIDYNIPVTGWKYWINEEWVDDPDMRVEISDDDDDEDDFDDDDNEDDEICICLEDYGGYCERCQVSCRADCNDITREGSVCYSNYACDGNLLFEEGHP